MAEFGWIKMSFLLMPVLQITAVTGRHVPRFTVRDGDEVTLPCENKINDHHDCKSTTWLFSDSGKASTLFEHGKIHQDAKAKSDRLIVIANCALVIKKVTVKDVGRYNCRQFNKSGKQQGGNAHMHLSVVTKHRSCSSSAASIVTKQKGSKKVTLSCSVSPREPCGHKVKWLYGSKEVDKNNKDLKISQSPCLASVTFRTHYIQSKNYELLKCHVTRGHTEEQLFTFRPQSSGEGKGATVGTDETESADNDTAKKSQVWWWYIPVGLALAALLIVVVAAVGWRRTKANATRTDDNIELTSHPVVTQSSPETRQDTADPEDGVSYTSVSYTRKTNSEARVRGKDADGDAVIYTTVKASSSSHPGASADPSNLYATVNKPKK